MHVSARSYLTAGIATIGAGAIALTPVAPISHSPVLSPAISTSLAVNLAASIDPITPWIDTLQTAADNIGGLFNTWAAEPFPIIQQVIANQLTYLGELPAIGTIIEQVLGNIGAAVQAPFSADLNTLDALHTTVFNLLPTLAPDLPQGLLDIMASTASGVLIGLAGPVLAPVVALVNSVTSIIDALGNSDFTGALNDLINIPANLVNAFLNGGQTIDITSILAPLLPASATLNSAGIVLGGLLSQGASLFNALAVNVTVKLSPVLPAITLDVPGTGAGVFGSLIAMTKGVASAIEVVPAPTAAVAPAAAVAEIEAAPVAIDATSADAAPVALSAEPEATDDTATPQDAVTLAATVEEPVATTGDAPTRRGHDGGTRAARSAPSATASDSSDSSGDDTGKASSGKARASRG